MTDYDMAVELEKLGELRKDMRRTIYLLYVNWLILCVVFVAEVAVILGSFHR